MHEAGAAVVAAQLLAFSRDPVRYRARLTHGREVLPGGLLVFRFAQSKFPNALLRDYAAPDRERLRQAADFFIRHVCLWEGATHYQVLALEPGARRELVKDHYHALIALLHPDRAEPGAPAWPDGAAQRVNAAYEVLRDDERRREYDASLRKAPFGPVTLEEVRAHPPGTAALHASASRHGMAARVRLRRPALVVGSVVAGLFFAYMWAAESSWGPSESVFDASSRFARHWAATGPRVLPVGQERRLEAPPAEGLAMLAPLWRSLTGAAPPPPPDIRLSESPRVEPAPSVAPPVSKAAPLVAQAPAPKPPPGAAAEGISRAELETLVALLVNYYEAGDLERFLALQDAASLGVWGAIRLREEFHDFFRATRARKLRLTNVSLEPGAATARARGEATVSAEYVDAPARIERAVKLELDVVQRDGQLRISRLTLFPHGG